MYQWNKQREDDGGWVHTLAIEGEGAYMKVEKSRGGDYTVTAMLDDDPCGGDMEYRPTLELAKKEAERIVTSGEWVDYLP